MKSAFITNLNGLHPHTIQPKHDSSSKNGTALPYLICVGEGGSISSIVTSLLLKNKLRQLMPIFTAQLTMTAVGLVSKMPMLRDRHPEGRGRSHQNTSGFTWLTSCFFSVEKRQASPYKANMCVLSLIHIQSEMYARIRICICWLHEPEEAYV